MISPASRHASARDVVSKGVFWGGIALAMVSCELSWRSLAPNRRPVPRRSRRPALARPRVRRVLLQQRVPDRPIGRADRVRRRRRERRGHRPRPDRLPGQVRGLRLGGARLGRAGPVHVVGCAVLDPLGLHGADVLALLRAGRRLRHRLGPRLHAVRRAVRHRQRRERRRDRRGRGAGRALRHRRAAGDEHRRAAHLAPGRGLRPPERPRPGARPVRRLEPVLRGAQALCGPRHRRPRAARHALPRHRRERADPAHLDRGH